MSEGESHRWPGGADAMKEMMAYYEQRAPVYDSTVNEKAASEAREVLGLLAELPPARTLDVGCGTGFLTCRLAGEIVGLDQSAAMVAQARRKVPYAQFVRGDALRLPFGAAALRRVTAGFLYGHLLPAERSAFLAEARRVAAELVVVEPAADPRSRLKGGSAEPCRTAASIPSTRGGSLPRRCSARSGGARCFSQANGSSV